MAKKITVAMLKKQDMTKEEIEEMLGGLFDTLVAKIDNLENIDFEKAITPLDATDPRDLKILGLFGAYGAFVVKTICTPAAYKYIVEEARKAMKAMKEAEE